MALVAAAWSASWSPPAAARVLIDRDRALAQAFGADATIRARTVFLSPEAARSAEQAAGAKLASPRIVRHEAWRGDSLLGTGYVESHRVRTMNETVLVVVTPAGRVGAVEILAFDEPDDYRAPPRWLDTFTGKSLSKDLKPGRLVPHLGGSTLTARAVASAVRRALALHAAIGPARAPARR